MRQISILILMVLLQLALGLQQPHARDDAAVKTEVQQGFEEILNDWRDGRFEELYARTSGGKLTREAFVKRFAESALKPTCCWDKLQEVTVTLQTASKATLHGTVGLESAASGETKTKSFKMSKEGGIWRISQSELVGLIGTAKKRHRKIILRSQP